MNHSCGPVSGSDVQIQQFFRPFPGCDFRFIIAKFTVDIVRKQKFYQITDVFDGCPVSFCLCCDTVCFGSDTVIFRCMTSVQRGAGLTACFSFFVDCGMTVFDIINDSPPQCNIRLGACICSLPPFPRTCRPGTVAYLSFLIFMNLAKSRTGSLFLPMFSA